MTDSFVWQRPMIAFDIETTGLDLKTCKIVEIACIDIHAPDKKLHYRLNPGIAIEPAAKAIHGINNADVADAPRFEDIAQSLFDFLEGCDLTGFNIEKFDLPILQREFAATDRCLKPSNIIDTYVIFVKNEPRDLNAAYRFYCGEALTGAHQAQADAKAAADILLAQLQRYPHLPSNSTALRDYCHPTANHWIDPDGKIIWQDNQPVLNFGKYKNRSLQILVAENRDYLEWIASKSDFSTHVIKVVQQALSGCFPEK